MSLFAIADLHLSMDEGVDKPMDKFGGAWVGHVKRLENCWRSLVGEEDTVLIPGDISWAIDLDAAKADLAFVDSLPGKKVLLRGNHDYWWASMKKMNGLFPSISYIQNNCYSAEGFIIIGSRGWAAPGEKVTDFSEEESRKIYDREVLRLKMSYDCAKPLIEEAEQAGKPLKLIAATHFPPFNPLLEANPVTEFYEKIGVDIAVYGHLHGAAHAAAFNGNKNGVEYRLVALDYINAAPLMLVK